MTTGLLALVLSLFMTSHKIDNNIHYAEEAFEKQKEASNNWENFIEVKGTEEGTTLSLKPNNLTIKGVLTVLQTWRDHVKGKKCTATVPIAGEQYSFTLQKGSQTDEQAFKNVLYDHFLSRMDRSTIREQKQVAAYMLEASDANINDSGIEWEKDYPFLKKVELRDVCNRMLIQGMVVEATAPSIECFKQLTKMTEQEGSHIKKSMSVQWKDKIDDILEDNYPNSGSVDYDRIFRLVGNLETPDLEKIALEELNWYIGQTKNPFYHDYDDLMATRRSVIQDGQDIYFNLLKDDGVCNQGVPFADEVFRLILKRIKEMPDDYDHETNLWRPFLSELFPIHKGIKPGTFHMFYNEWIRRYYECATD